MESQEALDDQRIRIETYIIDISHVEVQMNLYTNPLALTCQFYHCSVPFRLDTYRGCQYSCAYCFAVDRNLSMRMYEVQPADISLIECYFKKSFEKTDQSRDVIVQCLRRRIPVHFGGMSDPFQPTERKLKITLKTLTILKKYDYPTILSTKSDLMLEKEYLEAINGMKIAIQITLTTSNNSIAKKLEPNAPSVEKRLEAFSALSDMGIWSACRLQPLIPRVNTQDLELIDRLSDAGCKHVMIEHYKLPTYCNKARRKAMSEICSFDIEKYYREKCPAPSGMFFELPPKEKIKNLRKLVRRIHEKSMTYGAADNDLHHFGDHFCCCGVGNLQGFENIFRHHNTKAVFDGGHAQRIFYSFIKSEWAPTGSIREIVNRKSRLKSTNKQLTNLSDFVRAKWNDPFSNNAPTDMLGILPSDEFDNDGNIIYKPGCAYPF